MCVLKCVKILGKMVKIRIFMQFYKSTTPFMQMFELQKYLLNLLRAKV
jgi:hypothetical protein